MQASALRLLGDFTLETPFSGGPIRVGRKAQALLALAAMHGNTGASRGRLVALLWPDHSAEDARSALRQCLHLLRRVLGTAADGLDSEGDHIVLREAAFDVDVRRFETLAGSADVASMQSAAELYRGDFLDALDAGVEFTPWGRVLRRELGVEPSSQTLALVDELRLCAEPALSAAPLGAPVSIVAPARRPEDAAVVDLLLRGWQFFTLMTLENMAGAREAYAVAVALAPGSAEAVAKLRWTHWMDSISGWVPDPSASFEKAHQCAARAIACDPNHMHAPCADGEGAAVAYGARGRAQAVAEGRGTRARRCVRALPPGRCRDVVRPVRRVARARQYSAGTGSERSRNVSHDSGLRLMDGR